MKKIILLSLTALAGLLNAQTENVAINPKTNESTQLDAQLYVNGNMRVQTIEDMDYSSDVKQRYKQLCWDPNTKYVYAKNIDLPYISSIVSYDDRKLDASLYDTDSNTKDIDVDPDDFFLFFTNLSIKPGEGVKQDKVVGFKNVAGSYGPLLGFYLGHNDSKYMFKSFYRFTDGYHLYYYDTTTNKIVDPEDSDAPAWAKNKPIWDASVYAVSSKYMYKLYNVEVKDFNGYWEGSTKGGKYGIELGKLIEGEASKNIEITSNPDDKEINATVKAKLN